MTIEEERERHAQLDTFGGYDWGDPVRLLTIAARVEFTEAQMRIATEVLESRCVA